MGNLSQNFDTTEFACKCGCGFGKSPDDIHPILIRRLELLRAFLNYDKDKRVGITITSGARCNEHNKSIGGAKYSAHTPLVGGICKAADILVTGKTHRYDLLKYALLVFKRIGDGKEFVHVDVGEVANEHTYDSPVAWTY